MKIVVEDEMHVPNPPPALLSWTKGESLAFSLCRMSLILRYSAQMFKQR